MTNRPEQDHARIRECLFVKHVINMARGVDWEVWSHPLPDPWEARLLMLCDAIEAGRLSATPHWSGKERLYRVCLLNVWQFLGDHGAGEEWAWLWETCQDWSPRCGRELPEPKTVGPREPALPQRRFAQTEVTAWYKERVAQWKPGHPIPSGGNDLTDARAKFGDQIPRDFILSLRHKFGRDEWNINKRGPKPPPPSQ